jgi:hypothetical protein
LETRKARCRWVEAAAPTTSHLLYFIRKLSSVVSPSSIGLEGGAFASSSVATRSAHVVDPLDASVVIVLVIGSDFAMPLVLVLRTLILVLRMLLLLASGVVHCLFGLVIPHCLEVG